MILNLCIHCDIEFKVSHGADPKRHPIANCPFCGLELDTDDQRESSEDEDEDEDA